MSLKDNSVSPCILSFILSTYFSSQQNILNPPPKKQLFLHSHAVNLCSEYRVLFFDELDFKSKSCIELALIKETHFFGV